MLLVVVVVVVDDDAAVAVVAVESFKALLVELSVVRVLLSWLGELVLFAFSAGVFVAVSFAFVDALAVVFVVAGD